MSSASPVPIEEPGDKLDDVLFNSIYGVRTIELNRPSKLNSLDASMCRKIIPRLLVQLVMLIYVLLWLISSNLYRNGKSLNWPQ